MKKKKSFVPAIFKVFLALVSFTGTIGLWNFLSNKDFTYAQGKGDSTGANPYSITLPPMPTLIPLITIDQRLLRNETNQTNSPTVVELRKVQISQSTASNQNSNNIASSPVIIPAPVTTTRSSR